MKIYLRAELRTESLRRYITRLLVGVSLFPILGGTGPRSSCNAFVFIKISIDSAHRSKVDSSAFLIAACEQSDSRVMD
jgi:hypothetical protein